ncbi:MAG: two-component system response regulator FlrC [Bermanella sp.]|jgi:two-component system response regulator FlrC
MSTSTPSKEQRTLLIVDDDAAVRDSLAEWLRAGGYAVIEASDGEQALQLISQGDVDLIISDGQMSPMDGYALLNRVRVEYPELPLVMMSGYGTIDKAVSAMKNSAAHYLAKPVNTDELTLILQDCLPALGGSAMLVAEDEASRNVKILAGRVSQTDATVLISGPSGAGKEVFAHYIHQYSKRVGGPFIALNCAAIPENMLEAMLFGYEKGAYTGAINSHIGKFEQAQAGTLLLDEISEMELSLQAKLLRVLQERELERLGGKRTIRLDVRVIATTNRDLRACVTAGYFREDLFYRLNVFPLYIPSLAQRPADILPIAEHILNKGKATDSAGHMLNDSARRKLLSHQWPGNVRELDNVIQRALILRTSAMITDADIQFENDGLGIEVKADSEQGLGNWMKDQERRQIQNAIRQGGNKKEAAAILGISPRTLRYKLARLRDEQPATPQKAQWGDNV